MGPIGSLITNILAYQASAKATIGVLEWGSSAARRVAGYMAKEVSRTKLIKNEQFRDNAVKFLSSDPVGRASSAGKMYANRVMRMAEHHPNARISNMSQMALNTVKDEALYLPANYMMYRVEKYKARTPEEKENTASFRKYYFGAPMVMSMGSSAVMSHLLPKASKGFRDRVRNVIGRHANNNNLRAIVNKTNNVAAASSEFLNKFNAHRQAIKSSISDKGLAFALGRTRSSWTGTKQSYSEEYRKFYDYYKSRGSDSVTNLQTTITSYIADSHTNMMNHLERSNYGTEARSRYIKTRTEEVKSSVYKMVQAYNDQAVKPNLFMKAAKYAGVHAEFQYTKLDLRQAALASGAFKFTGKDFDTLPKVVERYGSYNVGGNNLNLGRMSFDALSDGMYDTFSKGASGTILGMFGLNEAFKSFAAKNSLAVLTRHVAKDDTKLILGKSFNPSRDPSKEVVYNETMEKLDALDVAHQMTGLSGQDADTFIKSRVKGQNTITGESKYSMFLNQARHGTLMLNQGDLMIMHPGGNLKIESATGSGSLNNPRRIITSNISDATGIRYHSFSSSHSRSAKVMSSALGNNSTNLYDQDGKYSGKYYYGPNPYEDSATSDIGFLAKAGKALDIGQNEGKSVMSKVLSIFTKYRDPNNPSALYSNLFLENAQWRENVAKTNRGVSELSTALREARNKASSETFVRIKQKVGGKNLGRILSDLDENIEVPSDLAYSRYYIEEGDDLQLAAEKVKSFGNLLSDLKGNTVTSPYDKDLSEINHLQSIFPDGKNGFVSDISGATYRGKVKPHSVIGLGRNYKVTAIDEYNGKVLETVATQRRLQGYENPFDELMRGNLTRNYGASGDVLRAAVSDSEKSAYIAASHTGEMYHKIASEIKNVSPGESTLTNGTSNAITDHLVRMTGNANLEWKTTKQYYINSDSVISPWSRDTSENILSQYGDQIFAYPGKSRSEGLFRRIPIDPSRGIYSTQGVMNVFNMSGLHVARAFNDVLGAIGMGFSDSSFGTLGDIGSNLILKRVLPAGLVMGGLAVTSELSKKFLQGTPLGEGFGVAALNAVADARLGAQGFLDAVHATDAAKYLEDLMPGSISSPASGLIRGIGPVVAGLAIGRKFGPRTAMRGGLVGAAVGALTGGLPLGVFGEWDISKSRNELVDEYTGKEQVAVRKGRWWELGVTPFEGTRIEYFRPSMYTLARSDYKHSPGFKDSLITEMVGSVAPDVYAMKNYYSRPYPVTAGMFSNIPILSNVLGLTGANKLLGGGISMHEDDMPSQDSAMRSAIDNGFSSKALSEMYEYGDGIYSSTSTDSQHTSFGPNAVAKSSFEYSAGESINQAMDIVGIRGFLASSISNKILGQQSFYDDAPVLSSPSDINGITRSYWDMSLGGLMGLSEGIRRIIPHKRGSIDSFNPLTNTMPSWLPGKDYYIDFRNGDPYTLVPMGEARLPGAGYLMSHSVDITMPIAGEVMGEQIDSQVSYLLGMPEYMSERNKKTDAILPVINDFINQAKVTGDLLHTNKVAYNAKYDVYAQADAIIRGDKGQDVAVKFVPKGFAGQSNLNAFMVMSGTVEGMLMEVDPTNGEYSVQRVFQDSDQFLQDIRRGKKAGIVAAQQMKSLESKGKAMNYGNAMSWADRLKILSDVAPYSKETQVARSIVKAQKDSDMLSDAGKKKYYTALDEMDQKEKYMAFDEYRFSNLGDHITAYGKQMDAFYSKEYSLPERAVGQVWEQFSHLKTPLHSKLLHKSTALEEYERNYIYGTLMPQWDSPVDDFLGTYAKRMANTSDIGQSTLSWALGGQLLGGTPLAIPMALTGAASGIVNNIVGQSLPDDVSARREVMYQADLLEYAKYRGLEQSGNHRSYAVKASNTLTAYGVKGMGPDESKIGQFLGNPESYFVKDIIDNMTSDDLQKAKIFLPAPALASLYREMGHAGQSAAVMKQFHNDQMNRYLPESGASVYSSDVPINAPTITTLSDEGLNLHDSGMGWASQLKTISNLSANNLYRGEGVYGNSFSGKTLSNVLTNLDSENDIRNYLSSMSTSVTMYNDGSDTIEITLIER